ncbi:hypothetical protein BBP40_012135 [Aspergillus hancockii]|nr:hypothetical protein BBP40_012135 [Aspergillus hancockii]
MARYALPSMMACQLPGFPSTMIPPTSVRITHPAVILRPTASFPVQVKSTSCYITKAKCRKAQAAHRSNHCTAFIFGLTKPLEGTYLHFPIPTLSVRAPFDADERILQSLQWLEAHFLEWKFNITV